MIRLLTLLIFVTIGMVYAARSLGADLNLYMASRYAQDSRVALMHLQRAHDLAWFDHNTRRSYAAFFVRFRFHELRQAAVFGIERELQANPFDATLLVALIAYRKAVGVSTAIATAQLKKLRPNVTID